MLCDALVRSGYEAYVYCSVVSPELMTPQLHSHIMELHRQQGVEPIMVYPEVVSGNPLNGNVVVRYLLNRPGFLRGGFQYGDNDVIFSFTKNLQLPGVPDNQLLFLPPFDLRVFCLPKNPAKRIAGKVCYYQGRSAQAKVDPSLLGADAIEITQTFPDSWEALADIFQQCEYFYCTESSALAGEAALCGCISVVLPGQWAPLAIGHNETQGFGVAWGNTPAQIDWARKTLPLLREKMIQQAIDFWPALDNFIDVTQQAVLDYQGIPRQGAVQRWLDDRSRDFASPENRHNPATCHLVLVIVDLGSEAGALDKTLASLSTLESPQTAIQLLVLTDSEVVVAGKPDLLIVQVGADGQARLINELLCASQAKWFALLKAGDEIVVGGAALSRSLNALSQAHAVYFDELVRLDEGNLAPAFRPDLGLDLLIGYPAAMARHWFFRRDVWAQKDGFATDCQDAFELQYILRLIRSGGLGGLEHVHEPLLIADAIPGVYNPAEQAVLKQHLQASGYVAARVESSLPGCYEVDYGHVDEPLVSILVLVNGDLLHAQRCMDSLLENTSYSRYEVLLLDQGNSEPQILDWLSGIEQLGVAQLRVLRYMAGASAHAIRNDAVADAQGDYLLFLDARIGIISREWLQKMLNHALRPEVGSVGARLIDSQRRVRHAGLLLGVAGPAGRVFNGLPADARGYMQRLLIDQAYSGLTEHCLMIRRDLFIAADGFDETLAPWADVDLCLKLQQAGYLNIWAACVTLLIADMHEVAPTADQEDRMYDRWLPVLARDPAYSPNFALGRGGEFKLAASAAPRRPDSAFPYPTRCLAHPIDQSFSGLYRVARPFNALRDAGLIEGVVSSELLSVVELERYQPDVILIQRRVELRNIESMRRMSVFSRAFKVFDLDEYLPELPFARDAEGGVEVLDRLSMALAHMDRLIVPSPLMAQLFDGFCADLRVLQTCLDPRQWGGVISLRGASSKPRIGWLADSMHYADLELMEEVVKALADEVEWVCIGGCPSHLRSLVHEIHGEIGGQAYAARLAAMNLDLALVPLTNNLLNRCKSDIRLLEFGACAVPVICSDLEAFQGSLPATRVTDAATAWLNAIRSHLADPEASQRMGDALRDCVLRDRTLEGETLNTWGKIWLPN